MKKGLLFVFGIITFMFLGITDVLATDINQSTFNTAASGTPTNGVSWSRDDYKFILAPGTYTLTGNINIFNDARIQLSGVTTIDLGEYSITGNQWSGLISVVDGGVVTISGNGTITNNSNGSRALIQETGSLTIEGGTFSSIAVSSCNLTINDGTFTSNSGVAVQIDGTFTSNSGTAVRFVNGDHKVTGGTFTANYAAEAYNVTKLEITDGTFNGVSTGLLVDYSTVLLSGGTYKGSSDTDGSAIKLSGRNTINDLLVSGYKYSTDSTTIIVDEEERMNVKETSVIPDVISDDTTRETVSTTTGTDKNPKTGDNIFIYVILLVVSSLGVVFTTNKMRKVYNKN